MSAILDNRTTPKGPLPQSPTLAAMALGLCLWLPLAAPAQAQQADQSAYLTSPANGGPRRWETTAADTALRKAPAADAAITRLLDAGALLANLGCRNVSGQIWCAVRPLRGGGRGHVAAGDLRPARGPDGTIVTGPDDSRARARARDFDDRRDIACAQERGQELGQCSAAVARAGGGDATIVVTFPNGFARSLFFVNAEFLSASATMSGVGTDTDWRVEAGRYLLRVDDQRFELPMELVTGGEPQRFR